jgi:DNA-binding transcriptional LysR family regulator
MDGFTELAVFVRVAQTLSFTAAGRALGLTPSGVSRAISRLERRLGVRLLQRTTRSISLTDDGASYYARCARILNELEAANLAVGRSGRVPRGRLRVDAPTVLARWAPHDTSPSAAARASRRSSRPTERSVSFPVAHPWLGGSAARGAS